MTRDVARRRPLAFGVGLSLAVAACSGSSPESASERDDASTAIESTGGGSVDSPTGARLLSEASTLTGEPVERSLVAGQPVVAWFWAPWCVICRAEAPDVVQVADDYAGRVAVIGVAGRGSVDAMVEFVQDTGTGALAHVDDSDGLLWAGFGVFSQPSFAFIDGDGTTEMFFGPLGEPDLRKAIERLLVQ